MDDESRTRVLQWSNNLDILNYEEILGITTSATVEDCRAAYYQFARAFHPDAHPAADDELRAALARVFQRGVEAYRVMTHPQLRARWLQAKSKGAVRLKDLILAADFDVTPLLHSLHEHCRSGGAKLHAQQAAQLHLRGRYAESCQHLQSALSYDGNANPYIERCIEAIRTILP